MAEGAYFSIEFVAVMACYYSLLMLPYYRPV